MGPYIENYYPDSLPSPNPDVKELRDRAIREAESRIVVGINLNLLGLSRSDVVNLKEFPKEVVSKINDLAVQIRSQFKPEEYIPDPYDIAILTPEGIRKAFIQPLRSLQRSFIGEGETFLADMKYIDEKGEAKVERCVVKRIKFSQAPSRLNKPCKPSRQIEKFQEFKEAGVKVFDWLYRDTEDTELYSPDLSCGGLRDVIDLNQILKDHKKFKDLPEWVRTNRLSITKGLIDCSNILSSRGFSVAVDTYFVIGPKPGEQNIDVLPADLGQGLDKHMESGGFIRDNNLAQVRRMVVDRLTLVTDEEWNLMRMISEIK
jgi:hypothetical protein